ncbi:hypothetical protein LIER_12455 [Lithospermum erythrorhizon]|uniref:Gag-protease polyprotein n=1 Tax=Lithospermum erythrorhizon TaxID=34254 RepID=A0AAV3PRZ0_LITER
MANEAFVHGEPMTNKKYVRKKKGVALNASCKEGNEEELKETMSLLAKKFNKTMKRFNKKPYSTRDSSSGNDRRFDSWNKNNKTIGGNNSTGQQNQNQQNQGKGIQCRKCEGFGHIQVQCPNYIKKQNKNYYITYSDEDSDEEANVPPTS